MNNLLAQIIEIAKLHPWQEKLLLVPSCAEGNNLLAELARAGLSCENIRPGTAVTLARELLQEEMEQRGLSPAGRGQAIFILEQILSDLYERQQLQYFRDIYKPGLLSEILLPSIHDLRMAGIDSQSLHPGNLVEDRKGRELAQILNYYELAMESYGLWDEAELFFQAGIKVENDRSALGNRIIIIIRPAECSFVSSFFLSCLAKQGALILPEEASMNPD